MIGGQNNSNVRNSNRPRNSYQGNATKRPDKLVNDYLGGGHKSQISNLNPSTEVCSLTVSPIDLPNLFIHLDGIVINSLLDTGASNSFLSFETYTK